MGMRDSAMNLEAANRTKAVLKELLDGEFSMLRGDIASLREEVRNMQADRRAADDKRVTLTQMMGVGVATFVGAVTISLSIGGVVVDRLIDRPLGDAIRRIEKLEAVPTARPDPFTGTQGNELRDRIEKLERAK
jgi:hypothetical protein